MYVEIAILGICFVVLLNNLFNSFLLRRVHKDPQLISDSVSVLLPMRNEAENVYALIASLKAQMGLEAVTFHCLNDQSTDGTHDELVRATHSDSRFFLHDGKPLPAGWIGKPFALQQALELSESEIVIIIDADVRLSPHAIASAITLLNACDLDFLSAYPRQIVQTWGERLIQPLLQWSWLSTVPLRLAEKLGNSSFAVANGQFFVVRRSALSNVGGFERISHHVLDDISLARLLLKSGFRGTVSDASKVASCRMYSSWSEIKAGYGKSLKTAFKSPLGFLVTLLFLLATGPGPLLLALSGSQLGLFALTAVILSRAISAYSSGGKINDAFFQPLSTTLLIYLIVYSLLKRNQMFWKGRPI